MPASVQGDLARSANLSVMGKAGLEEFLESTAANGQVDSQGVFTLEAAQALRKIADYQLPFAGAWAVKIIQSIVAGNSSGIIRVHLKAKEVCFVCLKAGYNLDELEEAFYNPEPSPNRSLRHLLTGLWPIAVSMRW